MKSIVVLVSGGGTNLQALIDAQANGIFKNGKISCVLSSNDTAYALERAKKANIATLVIKRKEFATANSFDEAIIKALDDCHADLVILAGFMSILGKKVTDAYENKIINVHPSLIPSFCGEGFYGLRVHQAALDYGVKLTGATVHFVNEVADGGKIILQKAVEILSDDTPETLQKRVMEQAEWDILPRAVALLCDGASDSLTKKTVSINQIAYGSGHYYQAFAFRNETLRKPIGLSLMNDDLSHEDIDTHFCAFQEDVIVGNLILTKLEDHVFKLRQVVVDERLRYQSIGRQLVCTGEAAAKSRGCQEVVLSARLEVIAFYEKLGYHAVGEEYIEVNLPHILMCKKLN